MKNFLIYKSSAGSGKTYTLVKEYLRLVLTNPADFRHTLAITFTNKAAAEMKSRVLEKLAELAAGNDPGLEETLIKEGVKGNIAIRAAEVLSVILHKYSYFSVLTIDAFFHKVIRSFAKELKLQLGYDIELDLEIVLAKIIDEIFDQAGEDEKLRGYLEDFVFYNIEEEGDWKIEYRVKELSKEIFKERYWEKKEANKADLGDSREKMLEFISVMFAIVSSFESTMNTISESANKLMDKYKLSMLDFSYGKSGFMNYLLNKIQNKEYEPKIRVREAYANPRKWYTKIPRPNVQTAMNEGLCDLLVKAVDNYDNNHKKYYSAKELTRTIYILGIFNDLLGKLKGYREENRLQLISDTNILLRSIIKDEPSPFIYEKVGNVYKNYLIDEFQDTSNYQWSNLLPLVINSISEGNFSMIVGDVKQSVYRWRSGNMKLLLEKVEEDLSHYKDLINEKYLTDNWRSLNKIVSFNNKFFASAAKQIAEKNEEYSNLILDSYKEVTQNNASGNDGGYVTVNFIAQDKESEFSVTDKSNMLTLEYIKQLTTDCFELRDIMILCRKNKEASEIAGILMESGYKVVSNESLLITNSPKVKLLINLLKFISDNSNSLAKTEILYNYLVYIKGNNTKYKEIFEDYRKSSDSLFASVVPDEFFNEKWGVNRRLTSLNLYELVESLIRIFSLNNSADAYLQRFVDAVLEYVKKDNSDITAFMSWWDGNKEKISIVVPEQENAIKILTVHNAKGLQSPAVIIPYANWDFDVSGTKDFIWVSSEIDPFSMSPAYLVRAVKSLKDSYFKKDYEEEYVLTNIDNLNLLYVAFTRAIERLHVICPDGYSSFNAAKLIKNVVSPSDDKKAPGQNIEYGIREKKKSKSHGLSAGSYKTDSFISSDYLNKAIIQTTGKNLKYSAGIKLREKISKGILLHTALAQIITGNDIESSVNKLQISGLIMESEKDFYSKELNEIINMKEAKDWYSGDWEVKTETDLLIPEGKAIRPDRVLIKDDSAIVIDYKTGSETKEHVTQINEYADALKKSGFKSVEKYIYYITQRQVKKI